MSTGITVFALLSIWSRLPELAGAHWPSLCWRLLDALNAYQRAADDDGRARAANEILRLARQFPDIQRALREALLSVMPDEQTKGIDTRGEVAQEGLARTTRGNVQALLDGVFHPQPLTRYTDIQVPSQVQTGKRFALIVGLTRHPSPDNTSPQEIQARPNQSINVVLTSHGPEVLSETSQTLRVEPERDSQPIVFYLRAQQAGTQSVMLDFYSEQALLASQFVSLEAVTEPVMEQLVKPVGQTLSIDGYKAPYPDLILRVSTVGNRLTYHLHFADTRMLTIEGDPLQADPRTFRHNLMLEIERLRELKDVDGNALTPKAVCHQIDKIGQRLYRQLFSEALRREYRRFRNDVHTLEIISDEPWIPWELIKPFDSDEQLIDDDFLCARFDMARWMMPGSAPAAEMGVNSLACIAPADSGLASAQLEREHVQAMAKHLGKVDCTPASATFSKVEALLEGEMPISLWHFACHGNYEDASPDNSPLLLSDHMTLHPNDLVGQAEARLRHDRPFVFLNACRTGSLGLGLTGLGGWAKVLVSDCRVGALIAPLWSVTDKPARQFAEEFYAASQVPGCTLAQAMRHARDVVRKAAPDDPTWLAYSLYAHPNARLQWQND